MKKVQDFHYLPAFRRERALQLVEMTALVKLPARNRQGLELVEYVLFSSLCMIPWRLLKTRSESTLGYIFSKRSKQDFLPHFLMHLPWLASNMTVWILLVPPWYVGAA